jgi:hypothetical protein
MKQGIISPAGTLFQPTRLRLRGGLTIHVVDGVLSVIQTPASFMKLQSTWPSTTTTTTAAATTATTTTTTLLNFVSCNHMTTCLRRLKIKFTAIKLPSFTMPIKLLHLSLKTK